MATADMAVEVVIGRGRAAYAAGLLWSLATGDWCRGARLYVRLIRPRYREVGRRRWQSIRSESWQVECHGEAA